MRPSVLFRAAALAGAAAVLAVTFAAPAASAHVSVSSASAVQGGYAKVTFRVPNEKSNAGTAKLEIVLPTAQPIVSATTKPIPGWTVSVEQAKLPAPVKTDDGEITEAVSKIVWTAGPGAAIQAGQFQEFDVSLGPLPKADQIVFKALQTYTDGEIVRWIEEPTGGAEPEYPAPVLKLAPASAGGANAHGGGSGTGSDSGSDSGATAGSGGTTSTASGDSDDNGGTGLATGLAAAGLAVGVAGLVLALLAYRKASSRPTG
jgi:periplasmic copper chaperone A